MEPIQNNNLQQNNSENSVKGFNEASTNKVPDGGVAFDVKNVNKAGANDQKPLVPNANTPAYSKPVAGGNIGKEAEAPNRVQLSKSTLAGMYQSAGSSSRLGSRIDINFAGILNYLVIIINLALIGALCFLVLVPQYNLYVSHQSEIVEAKEEFTKVDAHYQYLKNLESLEAELYKNIDIAKQAITVEEDVPQFLNQIAVMAKDSSIDLSKNDFSGATRATTTAPATNPDGSPAAVQPTTTASLINVRTAVTGTYDNLKLFLARLEDSRRLVSIADMKLGEYEDKSSVTALGVQGQSQTAEQVTSTDVSEKKYNLDLTLSGYYMKDPNIANLTVDQLINKPGLPTVIKTLEGFTYYELTDIQDVNPGRDNPFTVSESGGFEKNGGNTDTNATNNSPTSP